MKRRGGPSGRWSAALLSLGVLSLAGVGWAQPRARAAPGPRIAVLSTPPQGEETELILQPIESAQLVKAAARFRHLPEAIVRGAVLPQAEAVVVIADTVAKNDPSWDSSLLLVAPGRDPVPLLGNVYHGTRPLVLPDGRVFALTGTEGPEPSDADMAAGRLRVDTLEVYEVNLERSERKVVYRSQGYIAYLAGALDGEIIIYEVGPDEAQILAVDVNRADHPVRVLMRPLPAQARDFSIDVQNRALLFTDADENNPAESVAQRIDLTRPARPLPSPPRGTVVRPAHLITLDRSRLREIRAYAWPGRASVVSKDLGKMKVAGVLGRVTRSPPRMPAGVTTVRDFYLRNHETWAVALNRQPGGLPKILAIRADPGPAEGETRTVAAPGGTQLDIAGVLRPGPADRELVPAIMKERALRKPPNWIPRTLRLRALPTPRRGVNP